MLLVTVVSFQLDQNLLTYFSHNTNKCILYIIFLAESVLYTECVNIYIEPCLFWKGSVQYSTSKFEANMKGRFN